MDSNRKYFGMTVPQLGVLAGLVGALCLILCVAGYLIFGSGLSLAGPQPVSSSVVNATATLTVLPTATPTVAPSAIPYEQLIPQGWKQHKTELIEIWLPPEYKAWNAQSLDEVALSAALELSLNNPPSSKNLYGEFFLLLYAPLSTDTLDAFIDLQLQSLPEQARLVERRNVMVNTKEAVRLVFENRIDNIDVNELDYVFLDGNTVWFVEYAAQINEFYTQLDAFEKSILTFRLVK